MKLATLKDGSRDGQLIVVSRDLSQAHFAAGIATRLQQVLDDWNFISPQLEDLYATLNGGKARHAFAFEPPRCMAPLPRAYQWVQASAYPSHLQRLAPEAASPTAATPPLLTQCSSDGFLGPCQDARFANTDAGIDFSAGLAVITGDLNQGATPDEALDAIRLLMLANAWQLRHAAGQPAAAFAPVAVTPEELGAQWREGRVHAPLSVHWNGRRVGHCDTGAEMPQHFGHWLAQVAQTRRVRAGSILGAGAASRADATTHGCTSIAERRALELEQAGAAQTPYLQWGDTVRMEMLGENGQSIFGSLEQRVVSAADSAEAPAEAKAPGRAAGVRAATGGAAVDSQAKSSGSTDTDTDTDTGAEASAELSQDALAGGSEPGAASDEPTAAHAGSPKRADDSGPGKGKRAAQEPQAALGAKAKGKAKAKTQPKPEPEPTPTPETSLEPQTTDEPGASGAPVAPSGDQG